MRNDQHELIEDAFIYFVAFLFHIVHFKGTRVGVLFEFVFPGPTKLMEKQEQTTQLYRLKEKDKHFEFRTCSHYSRR